jgi:AcrR family transcriptional regulator
MASSKTRTPDAPQRKRSAAPARRTPLGRDAWLKAARTALIRDGIRGVQIGKLARRLKATRGGFYWFFDSHRQLLDELLVDWERTNNAAFKAVLRDGGTADFRELVDIWIDETAYSSAWDAAVRDWARVSAKVATAVRRVDDERIEILTRVFAGLGYDRREAFVRARITYFHQVGYYALGVRESRDDRLALLPYYTRVLTGR